ncbi:MAG: ABC transporter permease [Actinobacteria bacterium]|nr:ABC transporter permease [Actinomycetota bacterium]
MGDRADDIVSLTLQHAWYVASVAVAAVVTAVGVGILVRHHRLAKEIALGIAAVFLTIPSLALFVLFIPLVGLGFWPTFIALYMYALLPILRNTVTGLNEVSPAVLESARGMGMSRTQRLWRVEMPLAWPVIIAGIRVSVLMTTGIAAIATLVAGGGLGDFIKNTVNRYPLPTSVESVWTGTVFTVLLALAFDGIVSLVRRLTTPEGIR